MSVDEMTAQIIDARSKERRQMQATIDALVATLEEAQLWIAKDTERGIASWKIADAALALARGE